MKDHQRINQDSGEFEYYTPIEIVNAARRVMGAIDLDPATSVNANKKIKARRIFTIESDGLNRTWSGRVWLNHPFSRDGNPLWIKKLIEEYAAGNVTQACCITYAATSERWFRPLLDYTQCFLYPRTNYYLPDGTKKRGVTKGSVVTYLGNNRFGFHCEFFDFGRVKA